MKIALIKKIYEKLPDFLKLLIGSVIRGELVNNEIFQKQYQELIQFEKLNLEQKRIIQFEKLKESLIYAYNDSLYYQQLFTSVDFNPVTMTSLSEIIKIPILTKQLLNDNLENIQIEKCKNFYRTSTGGTTGSPVCILLDKESIYKEKAFIYHYWSHYGYDYQKSRLVTFRGLEFNGKISKLNPLYNELQLNPFLLNVNTISRYIKKMNRFKADFLHGYPSAIFAFCSFLEQTNIKLEKKIKGVFFISENVFQYQQEKIESVLQCKTHSFYGHSERAIFASQNPNYTYTFHPLYGYAEIDHSGKIFGTSFINQKMPLVRYDTDDSAHILSNGELEITGHRTSEILFGVHGEHISASSINFHTSVFENILVYQFVQNEIGKAILKVVPINEKGFDKTKIQVALQRKLENILQIDVQQVDSIEYSHRGKYQMIIQHLHDY